MVSHRAEGIDEEVKGGTRVAGTHPEPNAGHER